MSTTKARGSKRPALIRGEPVVAKVLAATIAELASKGFGALKIEDVAERAGVARTTIYRRWPTKTDLVRAAIEAMPGAEAGAPCTGSLRGDLVALGMRVVTFADTPEGEAVMSLFAAAGEDEELLELLARIRRARDAALPEVFAAACARGEVVEPRAARLIGELLPAALFNRKMILRQRIDRKFVQELVDFLLERSGIGDHARR